MQMIKRHKKIPYPDYIAKLFPELFATQTEGSPPSARTITMKVTDDCNLRCTYCYQTCKKKKSMSFETAKTFIDYLLGEPDPDYINPVNSPAVVIDFIGGEPLLEIGLIRRISDYFSTQLILKNHPWAERYVFSICTNGILYFDERVQAYIDQYKDHLSINITLDGNRELHDACRVFPDGSPSYDIVIKAVKDCLKRGMGKGTKITISPDNVGYLYGAVVHMVELGFCDINANCVFEDVWDNAVHPAIFYRELKKTADYFMEKDLVETHFISLFEEDFFKPKEEADNENWCGGNGKMLACDPDGDLYPCIRYMETSLGGKQKPMAIGNIREGIGCTKDCRDCIASLREVTRRSQSTEECFHCPVAAGCSWCSAFNYQTFGTVNKRATFICGMHKANALANYYFWNTFYRKKGMTERVHVYLPWDSAREIIDRAEYDMLLKLAQED